MENMQAPQAMHRESGTSLHISEITSSIQNNSHLMRIQKTDKHDKNT